MKKQLAFRNIKVPASMDYGAIGYAGLAIAITIGAYLLRDLIVNDELYDRFRENISRFS